jgi:sulfate adenylyltransferase
MRNWESIAAFQTRNPIHRAHEYITKCALEITEGLLLHPLVGETKGDDIPADVRMKCYEVLMKRYYPKDRVVLAVYPQAMRYGGPREAIFHAVIRKNYGCTHFIVGRDHAASAASTAPTTRSICSTSSSRTSWHRPAQVRELVLVHAHQLHGHRQDQPQHAEERVSLSGTKVREMLRKGELPPPEFSRPEVAQILIDSMREQQP